jgi:hypothetical protein
MTLVAGGIHGPPVVQVLQEVLLRRGEAVQLDPMKPQFVPPGTKPLKLWCTLLLSTSAFKFNLRRHDEGQIYTHMQSAHETCHICRRVHPNRFVYFRDYNELEGHYRTGQGGCLSQALDRR